MPDSGENAADQKGRRQADHQSASISLSKVAALPVPGYPTGVAARIDTLEDATDASARILQAEATRALALLGRLEQSILSRAFRR